MKYLIRKLALLAVTLLAVSAVAFMAFQLIPGDPSVKLLGTEATEESTALLREELGLNRPVHIRYIIWLAGFVTGDFGVSYSYKIPVEELIGAAIPVTLSLSAISFLMVVIFSAPAGYLLARVEGSVADKLFKVVNQIVMSIPPFFIGIVFTYIFGFIFKLFTPGSFVSYRESIPGFFAYLILPALAIAIPKSAMTARLLRSGILAEMSKDYVRTAYSRGNNRSAVLRRHVFRNALVPTVSFLAMTLADIVAGSVIVERVFVIPGLGRMLLLAISNRDYPVVCAIVVIMALVVVVANFASDIALMRIDPRIRL